VKSKLLSDKQILDLIASGDIMIEPFEKERLGPVSYDLTTESESQFRGVHKLVSKETIKLSNKIVGLVCMRSRSTIAGWAASYSQLVDPGYCGKLIFLAWQPVPTPYLEVDKMFQIMFFKVGEVEQAYNERELSTAMNRKGWSPWLRKAVDTLPPDEEKESGFETEVQENPII